MHSFMNRILLLSTVVSYSLTSNEDFRITGNNCHKEYLHEGTAESGYTEPPAKVPPQIVIPTHDLPSPDLEPLNKKIQEISLQQYEETSEAFYLNKIIPGDDYYEDLGKFVQSQDNVNLLKAILGEDCYKRMHDMNMAIPYLLIDDISDVCKYSIDIDGAKYTLQNVVLTAARKVVDDLFFEYNAKYLGNDGKEIFCSEGPIPARYCGKQVEIFGKRYNVYEIFGKEVIHIAGSLLALLPISTH